MPLELNFYTAPILIVDGFLIGVGALAAHAIYSVIRDVIARRRAREVGG
jgi:hypothetical protein